MLENISFSFWLYFWRDFVHLHARRRFPAFQTFKLASNKLIENITLAILRSFAEFDGLLAGSYLIWIQPH